MWKCKYIETSAKDNNNVTELFEELLKLDTTRQLSLQPIEKVETKKKSKCEIMWRSWRRRKTSNIEPLIFPQYDEFLSLSIWVFEIEGGLVAITIQHYHYECCCIRSLDIILAGLQANFIMRPGTRSDPNRWTSLLYSFRLAWVVDRLHILPHILYLWRPIIINISITSPT